MAKLTKRDRSAFDYMTCPECGRVIRGRILKAGDKMVPFRHLNFDQKVCPGSTQGATPNE